MGEIETLLGDLGVKQWVKNKFLAKLQDYHKSGSKDVDSFVDEFNHEIFADFKVVANESITEVLEKAKKLL